MDIVYHKPHGVSIGIGRNGQEKSKKAWHVVRTLFIISFIIFFIIFFIII